VLEYLGTRLCRRLMWMLTLWHHLSAVGASDQAHQAFGGVGCFRCFSRLGGTGQGKPRHRHRSSQRFSALGCHLPGHEGAEVRRALATTVRTGLEEGVQPMVWIEPPQQDGLDHTQQHRRPVGAPHTARTVLVLAADDRVAQDALRGVSVHEQVPRSPRRNALPVKRIDGALLMGHKHLAGARIELKELGKTSACTHRILQHAPEACDGVAVMSPVGR
jgi:hypothetical protein